MLKLIGLLINIFLTIGLIYVGGKYIVIGADANNLAAVIAGIFILIMGARCADIGVKHIDAFKQ